jgi:hypothetical protein
VQFAKSLCESCRHMREVRTPKGSRFLLCQLSTTNAAFVKYPRQPTLYCNGYQSGNKDAIRQGGLADGS